MTITLLTVVACGGDGGRDTDAAATTDTWVPAPDLGQVVETVQDHDGNVYHGIKIGNQVWLQENLASLSYEDGTPIPDVVAFDNNEDNARLYGRLYTWNAAMRGATSLGAQGAAPAGYHIPSDAEWTTLESSLGGQLAAGGRMKAAGTDYWTAPNTGATNASGLTILPGGEYDAYDRSVFQLLHTHAVFWTSTNVSSDMAREKYLAFDSAMSRSLDWHKGMKYSIRCIKN